MTIREMKALSRRIDQLKSKRARLRAEAENISPSLSGTPGAGNVSDKVGATAARIADIDSEIKELTTERDAHLSRLSHEVFEENCIYLHIDRHRSWRWIAIKITGRTDTAESIRKRCSRYKW